MDIKCISDNLLILLFKSIGDKSIDVEKVAAIIYRDTQYRSIDNPNDQLLAVNSQCYCKQSDKFICIAPINSIQSLSASVAK